MIRTKFYVHSDVDDNNIRADFDNQVDAIAYASGFSPMDKCYVVEATVDVDEESGEVLRELESETIWTFEDLPTEDAFGVNDWPDVSIKDEEEMKLDTDFDVKDIHEELEAREDLVECQHCFDLFPKEECTKIEYGYLCPHCHSLVVKQVEFPSEMVDDAVFGLEFPEPCKFDDDGDDEDETGEYTEMKPEEPTFVSADEIAPEEPVGIEPPVEETPEVSVETPVAFADIPVTVEGSGIEDGSSDDSSDEISEILDEHVQDRPAPIEDKTELHGMDNAVVDCQTDMKVIAHSEDEKPLDCLMKKPALEKPLAGEKVDIKLTESLDDELVAFAASLPEDLNEEVLDEGPINAIKNAIAKHSFNKNYGDAGFKLYKKENGKKDWEELLLKAPVNNIKDAQKKAKDLSTESNIAGIAVKIAADKPEDEKVVLVYKKGTEIVNNIKDINSNDKAKARDDEINKKVGVVGVKSKEEPEEKKDEVPPAEEKKEEPTKEEPKAEETPVEKKPAEEAPTDETPVAKRDMSKQNEARAQYKKIEKALEILGVDKSILRDGKKVTQKFKDLRKALFTESYADMPFDSNVKEGDKIKIIHMEGEDTTYDGAEGTVERIDSIGQLHGTWGGLAVIPGVDEFEIINESLTEEVVELTKKPGDGTIDKLKKENPAAIIVDPKDPRFKDSLKDIAEGSVVIIDGAENLPHGQGIVTRLTRELGCKVFEVKTESLKEDLNKKYIVRFDFSAFPDFGDEIVEETFDTKEEALKYIEDSYDNWYFDNFDVSEEVIFPILCAAQEDDWDEDENGNYILESLKSLKEAKKDEEEPIDPEQAKLDAHTMLNQLVADEIEAIDGYEASKTELLDKPLEHKEEIIHTIDHIKDEEKEHIDELIQATRKIPFEKPAVEELEEASSAEKRAFKDGGKAAADYLDGKAIARIKDKDMRDAAVALKKAEASKDALDRFVGDRKQAQAEVAFDKKQQSMANAGYAMAEELHKNEEALVAEWARQGVEVGYVFDEDDYAGFEKLCKDEGVKPSEELFKHYFKCVDDLVGVKEESLEWTADKDLADDRTPAPTPKGELGEPLDGTEVRKHEKAIKEDINEDDAKIVDYVEYKHSYCHALEPKLKKINYYANVLKKPVNYIKAMVKGIIKDSPEVRWTDKEVWFWDQLNQFWPDSYQLFKFIKNSIEKAHNTWVYVDADGELIPELNKDMISLPIKEDFADDEIETCAWCGEEYPISELRKEVDLGYLCSGCEQAIKSRGEKLIFEESLAEDESKVLDDFAKNLEDKPKTKAPEDDDDWDKVVKELENSKTQKQEPLTPEEEKELNDIIAKW